MGCGVSPSPACPLQPPPLLASTSVASSRGFAGSPHRSACRGVISLPKAVWDAASPGPWTHLTSPVAETGNGPSTLARRAPSQALGGSRLQALLSPCFPASAQPPQSRKLFFHFTVKSCFSFLLKCSLWNNFLWPSQRDPSSSEPSNTYCLHSSLGAHLCCLRSLPRLASLFAIILSRL